MTIEKATLELESLVRETRLSDIPKTAREQARIFLLDTLMVGLSGATEPSAADVRRAAQRMGTGTEARPIGCREPRAAPAAAFISAYQIHCQEWDCVHEPAVVHAMSVITAALTAFCQRDRSISGSDLILGLCLGVEIAARIGTASRGAMQFFRPGTAGLMGATAALARINAMDQASYRNALGLAYSQAAGSMQSHLEGSATMAIKVGLAARGAITAYDLADVGLEGPKNYLEGPFGFMRLIEQDYDQAALTAELGQRWAIGNLSHKPYPSGRASHGALDALTTMVVDNNIPADNVESITLYAPPLIQRLVARPMHGDMSRNYARLSLPYLGWRLILDGRLDANSFSDEKLIENKALSRADDLQVKPNDVTDPNALGPQRLEVILRDGSILNREIKSALGAPDLPLSEAERDAKALNCLANYTDLDRQAALAKIKADIAAIEDTEEAATLMDGLPYFTN